MRGGLRSAAREAEGRAAAKDALDPQCSTRWPKCTSPPALVGRPRTYLRAGRQREEDGSGWTPCRGDGREARRKGRG